MSISILPVVPDGATDKLWPIVVLSSVSKTLTTLVLGSEVIDETSAWIVKLLLNYKPYKHKVRIDIQGLAHENLIELQQL